MSNLIPPHIFRAYDIRGIYNQDINTKIMHEIGIAFGTYVKTVLSGTDVVVGNDIRYSSPPLAFAFIAGVTASGVNVHYTGTSSFGQTLFACWMTKKNACAFITASHLPAEWNGIKFYHSDGVGFSEEELIEIKKIVLNQAYTLVSGKELGEIKELDITSKYADFFKEKFHFTKKIKVALDCGGGSTTLSAPSVFEKVGLEIIPIFCEPDPAFSGRPSDPKPKNLQKLIETVKTKQCHFGVAFDGDGDRAVIVDDTGRVLSADETGIIIGKYGLKTSNGTIIANVECSKVVKEQLEQIGFKIKQIPVGHTFLTIEAKQEQAPLGIESSGHIIITEYFLFDDAIIVPLKIAEILNNKKCLLSALLAEIPTLPRYKEEVECDESIKFLVIDYLKQKFSEEYANITTLDGIRIDLQNGWVLIRASNTSPIIRLTVEGDNEKAVQEMVTKFITEIKSAQATIKNIKK
ncbi:MAG: hypothetical protein ACTSYD_06365 [Candidatus Heimdallarchaeaceae archaeon]